MYKDRKMTYKEFQISLLELNLNIKDFAQILGMNPNSITNYKLKGYMPLQLSIIINLMLEMKKNYINYEDIINEAKRKFADDSILN